MVGPQEGEKRAEHEIKTGHRKRGPGEERKEKTSQQPAGSNLEGTRMTRARPPRRTISTRGETGQKSKLQESLERGGNALEKFLTYQLDGRIGAYHGDHG